jgi:hypothetical protein
MLRYGTAEDDGTPGHHTARISLRAPRAAIRVETTVNWQSKLGLAMSMASGLWGGYGFIYIPHSSGKIHPALARILSVLNSITYRRSWARARRDALTAAECVSPLGKRVYDLRHACVSTWLNGGIAPAQVAEWAGHSVAILLKIYAKCIDGQDDLAKRRIEEALGDPGENAGNPALLFGRRR